MRTIAVKACILLLAAAAVSPRVVQAQQEDLRKKVGFDQRLDEQVPLDLAFTDETGNSVKLSDYFGQKPVILVLAYYRCPMLCTQVLNGLTKSLRELNFTVGKEFTVLTVSFDPRETPELAAAKKKTYLDSYGRPGAEEGWHFLTGKQPAIDALTKAVGFRYAYDAKNDQFVHAAGIVILTPKGKISRYFRDIAFPVRDLRLGLVESSANKIGSPTDQILLYCCHYDPETGTYTASILNLVRAAGVAMVGVLAGMVGLLWWYNPHRKSGRRSPTGGSGENETGEHP